MVKISFPVNYLYNFNIRKNSNIKTFFKKILQQSKITSIIILLKSTNISFLGFIVCFVTLSLVKCVFHHSLREVIF